MNSGACKWVPIPAAGQGLPGCQLLGLQPSSQAWLGPALCVWCHTVMELFGVEKAPKDIQSK